MTNQTKANLDETCPLCKHDTSLFFHSDSKRQYLRCPHCGLIFAAKQYLPTTKVEKQLYDYHTNSPNDIGYRAFLNRLVQPLNQYLPANAYGLDFGCGPGPTLSVMLEEQGHSVDNYDPFYAPALNWRKQKYDFICCTEVIEHIHSPSKTLDDLWRCLKPDGVFGIMTKRASTLEKFSRWHYKNDPTHVRFYTDASFRYLAKRWQAELEFTAADVVIFKKPILGKGIELTSSQLR